MCVVKKAVHGQEARPEAVAEEKLRFAGRLPWRRQVRKMGLPTE